MTTQEAITAARQLAEHFRGRADGRRWRVWSDRARLLESAAADMAAEEREERERRARPDLRGRVLALLVETKPKRQCRDPFRHRRRIPEPRVIVLPPNGSGPDAA